MVSVYEDKRRRVVKDQERISFSSFSSFHIVIITASAKGKKQISDRATDDEDLTIKIDDKTYPTLSHPDRLIDSPAAFSGGTLHGLTKTVYFLTFLKGKDHTLELTADRPSNTATFESLKIYTLNLGKELSLEIEQQAENGDRRPWITIALDTLSLKAFSPKVRYSRRYRDSDDVKIIVDGKVQGNLLRNIKHFLWRYVGSKLPQFSTKTETETFTVNLSSGLHYLEFEADRMPILHTIRFDFGDTPLPPMRIPTVDDPGWTEDFYDDTADILLARLVFGEAENQPKEAKTAVGYSVINRVKKGNRRWGLNNREVILKENQYDAFWNPDRRDAVRDPLRGSDEIRREAWSESYAVAAGILNGSLKDPTDGATHFHSYPEDERERFPSWATEENFKIKTGDMLFYELER